MSEYKNVKIIPEKEKDSALRILFLKSFFQVYSGLAIPFIIATKSIVKGLFLDLIVSPFVCLIIFFCINRFADGFMTIFGQRKSLTSLREQMEDSLKAVKVAKMNKEFKKAMVLVNRILKQDPEFHEAMLVKAQILRE